MPSAPGGVGVWGTWRTCANSPDGRPGELGAGFVLVNPLGAAMPTLPQEPSPYYPKQPALFESALPADRGSAWRIRGGP